LQRGPLLRFLALVGFRYGRAPVLGVAGFHVGAAGLGFVPALEAGGHQDVAVFVEDEAAGFHGAGDGAAMDTQAGGELGAGFGFGEDGGGHFRGSSRKTGRRARGCKGMCKAFFS